MEWNRTECNVMELEWNRTKLNYKVPYMNMDITCKYEL